MSARDDEKALDADITSQSFRYMQGRAIGAKILQLQAAQDRATLIKMQDEHPVAFSFALGVLDAVTAAGAEKRAATPVPMKVLCDSKGCIKLKDHDGSCWGARLDCGVRGCGLKSGHLTRHDWEINDPGNESFGGIS